MRDQAGLTNADIPFNVAHMFYGNVPEPIEGTTDLNAVIVLENVKVQGFSMVDKRIGCDVKQAQETLNTLANFHALGIVLLRQHKTSDGEYALPESIKFVQEKLLFDDMGADLLSPSIPVYAEAIRMLGQPEAALWLQKQAEELKEILPPENIRKCGILATILHGDCWNNNMMYRTDEDGNVQMRLVDWQIVRLGHCVTDCLHFLFTSTSPELRAERFNQLMDNYFSTLSGALHKLGVDLDQEGYTNEEFRQDIRKRLRWALFLALMMLPGMLDQGLVDAMTDFTDEDVARLSADGRTPEDDLSEMTDKWSNSFSAKKIVENKMLGQRIVKMVLEVKTALE